jgi:hypothetical protein
MEQLDRLEQHRRRTVANALPKVVAILAKGSGWRSSQGVLFREANEMFVSSTADMSFTGYKTVARMAAKPQALDLLFWEILGLGDNARQPLSFRYFGAFTCQVPHAAEAVINDGPGEPVEIAKSLLSWSNERIPAIKSLEGQFTEHLLAHPSEDGRGKYRASLITSLILDGRCDEARHVAETAIQERDDAGYIVSFRGFPGHALKWLRNK